MRSTRTLGLSALLLAGIALLGPSAHASLVRWVTLGELGEASHLIVSGRVVSRECIERPVPVGTFTDYHVEVENVLKGEAPETIVVRLPGGTVDGRTTRVEGVPALSVGSQYLLALYGYDATRFGESASATVYTVLGSSQGVWLLSESPEGVLATRSFDGGFVDARGSVLPTPAPETMPLSDVASRLVGGGQ